MFDFFESLPNKRWLKYSSFLLKPFHNSWYPSITLSEQLEGILSFIFKFGYGGRGYSHARLTTKIKRFPKSLILPPRFRSMTSFVVSGPSQLPEL